MTRAAPMFIMACLAGLVSGCAPSAIFELELELPPAAPGARYVVVTAVADGPSVSLSPAIELPLACDRGMPAPDCDVRTLDPNCSAVVSVVSDEAPDAMTVEVVFCETPDCSDGGVAHRVVVERPFYPGRYTQGRVCLERAPEAPSEETLARCDVRCREGTARQSCRLDGTHFCE